MSWPAIVEFALQMVVTYVDMFMVKGLGEVATAIVGITTQANFLVKFPVSNMGIGSLAFISKAVGEKNFDKVQKASMQTIYLVLITGMAGMVSVGILSGILPMIMHLNPDVKKGFSSYFLIANSTVVFHAISSILGGNFRGIRDMKTPMKLNVCINILNIILNFMFIYPTREIAVLGHKITVYGCNMGLDGAGLGTALSIAVGGIVMFLLTYSHPILSMKNKWSRPNWSILVKFIRVGTPSAVGNLLNGIGRTVFTSFVSVMGIVATAAHSVAFQTEGLCYIPVMGLIACTTTLSGNTLGERNYKKFRKIVRDICLIGMGMMTVTGFLLFVTSDITSALFTENQEVVHLSSQMLRIVSFNEPLFAVSVILDAAFQGLGDTKKPFIVSTFTMVLFRICICYVLTQICGFGLWSAWVCMIGDNILRALILICIYARRKWIILFQ